MSFSLHSFCLIALCIYITLSNDIYSLLSIHTHFLVQKVWRTSPRFVPPHFQWNIGSRHLDHTTWAKESNRMDYRLMVYVYTSIIYTFICTYANESLTFIPETILTCCSSFYCWWHSSHWITFNSLRSMNTHTYTYTYTFTNTRTYTDTKLHIHTSLYINFLSHKMLHKRFACVYQCYIHQIVDISRGLYILLRG